MYKFAEDPGEFLIHVSVLLRYSFAVEKCINKSNDPDVYERGV